MKTSDGDGAFPESHPECPNPSRGMSLRDWFAGQALTGLLASETDNNGLCKAKTETESFEAANAAQAYEFADAMLAARKNAK